MWQCILNLSSWDRSILFNLTGIILQSTYFTSLLKPLNKSADPSTTRIFFYPAITSFALCYVTSVCCFVSLTRGWKRLETKPSSNCHGTVIIFSRNFRFSPELFAVNMSSLAIQTQAVCWAYALPSATALSLTALSLMKVRITISNARSVAETFVTLIPMLGYSVHQTLICLAELFSRRSIIFGSSPRKSVHIWKLRVYVYVV